MSILHLPTLLLATALVIAVAGVSLVVANSRGVASRAFSLWGAGMLVGAAGLALMACRPMFGAVADMAGSAAILGGTALSWSAARCVSRRDSIPTLILLGPAVYLAAAIGREPASCVGPVVALSAGGIYTLAAAYELWRSRTDRLPSRDAAMVMLGIHGAIHLGRGLTLAMGTVFPVLMGSPSVTTVLMLEALIHTMAMALLLLAMLKEQSLADTLAEARRLALQDGLTELPNRRHFDQMIEHEAARAVREQRKLALLMIDVDHFKGINDQRGHAGGDECLRAIAVAIRSGLRRTSDFVARFGGEEFTVLLPDTDEPGAEAVGAVIHEAVAALQLANAVGTAGRVTVSIGIAVLVPGRSSPRAGALLRAADGALYAAKALGRNRTEVAAPPAVAEVTRTA